MVLNKEAESSISAILCNTKKAYKPEADIPIKWNMRDLKSFFEKNKLANTYEGLLRESKIWRMNIFKEARDIELTIIIAMVKAHSRKRSVIKKCREKLTRYVFVNALMRVGHYAREIGAREVETILDWPEENHPRQIFDEEYQSALFYGVSCDKQTYHCGALKDLGFADSIYFSSMKTSSMLQFCDLLVGATKDFINITLERETDTLGIDCLRELRMKIRGAPDNIIGRGLIIAPTRGELIDRVRQSIPRLFT